MYVKPSFCCNTSSIYLTQSGAIKISWLRPWLSVVDRSIVIGHFAQYHCISAYTTLDALAVDSQISYTRVHGFYSPPSCMQAISA